MPLMRWPRAPTHHPYDFTIHSTPKGHFHLVKAAGVDSLLVLRRIFRVARDRFLIPQISPLPRGIPTFWLFWGGGGFRFGSLFPGQQKPKRTTSVATSSSARNERCVGAGGRVSLCVYIWVCVRVVCMCMCALCLGGTTGASRTSFCVRAAACSCG